MGSRLTRGFSGHDDEGAVQSHHPVHRRIEIVVIEVDAGILGLELPFPGFARRDASAVDHPRDDKGVIDVQRVGDSQGDPVPLAGKNLWAWAVRREVDHIVRVSRVSDLVDPEIAQCFSRSRAERFVGNHLLHCVGDGEFEGRGNFCATPATTAIIWWQCATTATAAANVDGGQAQAGVPQKIPSFQLFHVLHPFLSVTTV
jgi:hypothetical protein